jgi:hypothetical protein
VKGKVLRVIETGKYETPVYDGRIERQKLKRRIRRYERRYEISSEKMLERLSAGLERETLEILKSKSGVRFDILVGFSR